MLIENLQTQLNEHAERLEKNLEARLYRIMHEFEDKIYHYETQKIVEEHAAAERAIQNNGWIDFDSLNPEGLVDDEVYLVRQQTKDGKWKCPHLSYWDGEDKEFVLLHSSTFMAPIVHQYLKVPE